MIARMVAGVLVLSMVGQLGAEEGKGRPNVLLITVDDMNHDSLGVTGCKTPGVSPNIDRLASEAMLFTRAHVTIAVCQPTRAVWMTGRYPIHNGARGFEPIRPGIATLPETLKKEGYRTGILGKVPHVLPSRTAAWDVKVQAGQLKVGREPALYYQHTRSFLDQVKKEGKPFFLMANSQDPHRPFAGSDQEGNRGGFPKVENPYRPDQVAVPGFLPDLPEVRREIAEYYTSVRRADATVGEVLRALKDAGLEKDTLVMFLSDHGMPLPFAKTNCYYHATRTPWMVRWPGKVKAGSVDGEHFVSGIDLMPTVLDALGLACPEGLDGRSFLPLLEGKKQEGRDRLLTVFHRTSGRQNYEMRAAHDERYLYIFNAWADGKTVFRNESQAGRTMKAMRQAAPTNPAIAARVQLFLHRVPEELYDYRNDPDCLKNLIDDPASKYAVARMRRQLADQLQAIEDPLLKEFRERVAR